MSLLSFSIKIHDLNELKEVYTIVDVEEEKGIQHNDGVMPYKNLARVQHTHMQ